MKNRNPICSTALAAALMLAAAAPALAQAPASTDPSKGVDQTVPTEPPVSAERKMTRQEVLDELIAASKAGTLIAAGEAGAFENGTRLTSLATREEVRNDFITARNAGMLSPAGDAADGSTVLAAREAFNVAQAQQIQTAYAEAADRERLLALLNTPATTVVAAAETQEPVLVASAQPSVITESADGRVIDVSPATTETIPETPAPQDVPSAQQDPLAVRTTEDTLSSQNESSQPLEGTPSDAPSETTSDAPAGNVEGMTNEVATEPSQQ